MRSGRSFCNGTIFRKNLRRFAPLWAIYLGLLLLICPLSMGLTLPRYAQAAERLEKAADTIAVLQIVGLFVHSVCAVLSAAMCFKYLHRTRAAYTLHALPVNRSTQFCTNLLSGLLFGLGPILITALALLPVLLLFTVPRAFALEGALLLGWVLEYLFFYGLAVFCMHLTGRTVIGILSYFALNLIGWALPALVCATAEKLFYGFDLDGSSFTFLSPFIRGFGIEVSASSADESLLWILYAAVGLLLMGAAWLCYRRRRLELAGEAMIFGWAKAVFLILFTLTVGLTLGWIIWLILTGFNGSAWQSWIPFLLCLTAGCFQAYFGARMMLKRTVRVFNGRGWLGFGIFAAILTLFVVSLRFDVLSRQSWSPETGDVISAEVWTTSFSSWRPSDRVTLTDEEHIGRLIDAQEAILRDRSKWESQTLDTFYGEGAIHLTYHLRGGLCVHRYYEICDTANGDAAKKDVTEIYSDPGVCEAYYEALLPQRIDEAILNSRAVYRGRERAALTLAVPPEELRAAILEEARNGNLPVCNTFTEQDNAAYNELELKYTDGTETITLYLSVPKKALLITKCFGR